MVSQHRGIAVAGIGKSWRSNILFLLCLAIAGMGSVFLGQDANWDIKNYHLYNALSLLQGRLTTDLNAVGTQTYFHPLLDLPYYFMATNTLVTHPKILAFLMGLPFGVIIYSVFRIATIILKDFFQTATAVSRASLAATAIGVTGVASLSQLGTTFNEIPLAALMLCGLVLILGRLEKASGGRLVPYIVAGLLCGAAAGLKLTSAIYAPAITLAILCAEENVKAKLVAAFYYCLGWLLSFSVIWGWWGWKLYQLTGSPTFPMFNSIFKSPWLGLGSGMDDRFKPVGTMETLFYPFYWIKLGPMTVAEPLFADPRFAIGFVCFFIISAVLLIKRTSSSRASISTQSQQRPSLLFLLVFIFLAYVTWEMMFSIIRYAVVIEVLTGVLTLLVVALVFGRARQGLKGSLSACLLIAVILLVKNTAYPEWGRVPYSDTVFNYSDVNLPENSLVLLASKPVGYAATFLAQENPSVRFVGMVDGAVEAEKNLLQEKVSALIAQSGDNSFVIFVSEDFEATKRNLAKFNKKIDRETCRLFSSNIAKDIELCRVAPVSASGESLTISVPSGIEKPLSDSSLESGWSKVEPWGVWSEGSSSIVSVPLIAEQYDDLQLVFRSRAFLTPSHGTLYVNVFANDVAVGSLNYRYPDDTLGNLRALTIPAHIVKPGDDRVEIRYEYKSPASPSSLGLSADQRQLALGLESIMVVAKSK